MLIAWIRYKTHMLLSGILLWTGFLPCMAQETLLDSTISLKPQSATIAEFLTMIEKAGKLSFSYGNIVPDEKTVSIEGGSKTIREYLDEILEGIPVKYVARGGKILIVPGPIHQTVRGRVIDVETGSPLPGATIVFLTDASLPGVISDTNGMFFFERIPIGRHDIRAQHLGYQPAQLYNELISSGKQPFFEFALKEIYYDLPEVKFHSGNRKGDPKNDMATVSARSFSVEETRRYPAAINDPARMALVFPGVTTGDEDLFNELVIRGNSPTRVLWRIEGIEVPVPNHFAIERSTTGWVSMLSSSLMGRSDFFTGAFPAEYGNTLSGIFDISLRNGNNQENEYSFQFGSLGTDLAIEGPFSKNYEGSYLVNFRYASTYLVTKVAGSFEEEIIPVYYDLCYKIHLPTRKYGSFSLWGLGGAGKAEPEKPDERDTIVESSSSRVAVLGLTHLFSPNERSYLKTVMALSFNKTTVDKDSIRPRQVPVGRQDFSQPSFRLALAYRYKFGPRFSLKTGFNASHLEYDYLQYGTFAGGVNSSGSTQLLQGYAQGKISLARSLFLNTGLHCMLFALRSQFSLEPRFGLRWNFAREQSIGIGIGRHSQHEFLSAYKQMVELPDGSYSSPNRDMKLAKANHYVLSYDNALIRDLHFKTELYYQDLFDIPERTSQPYMKAPVNNQYPMDTLVNSGTGRNYGAEFTFEKYFSKGYYFIVSSSFYDSKVDPGNDTLYNTRYNAGFSQNVAAGKEFRVGRNRQNLIGMNAKLIWTGGNRGQLYDGNRKVPSARFEVQYKDYFRLDVNVSYRINRPGASHEIALDVQNVTNRENIKGIDWDHIRGEFVTDVQSGIFPFISYRVEF